MHYSTGHCVIEDNSTGNIGFFFLWSRLTSAKEIRLWAPLFKKDKGKLECVQKRMTNMVRGLETKL